MFDQKLSRRKMLLGSMVALAGATLPGIVHAANWIEPKPKDALKGKRPFRISINTSTISGFQLPVEQQIDLCAAAGFEGIELWVSDVEDYVAKGGTLAQLAAQLRKSGMVLENMIGFAQWLGDDPERRRKGLEQMRSEMEMTVQLGGKHIAATALGLKSMTCDDLHTYAQRYADLLRIGEEAGVTPLLEVWGAGVLNQLSDAMYICIASGHANASMLLDFYHLYRGNNSFESLSMVNGAKLPLFHINDYPANPAQNELDDADRVYPGDGICPFGELLPMLYRSGFRGALSLELFNESYWANGTEESVLKEGYEKCRAVIESCTYV